MMTRRTMIDEIQLGLVIAGILVMSVWIKHRRFPELVTTLNLVFISGLALSGVKTISWAWNGFISPSIKIQNDVRFMLGAAGVAALWLTGDLVRKKMRKRTQATKGSKRK